MTEFAEQQAFLTTQVGGRGSGAARYAAAMYFYNHGQMTEAMLEIYRRCSKFDREDPIEMALFEGVDIPAVSKGPGVGSAQ